MMTNSTSQEKVVFLAKAMISANDAVDNLRDKVKIQSTLWTILFSVGCVTFDLTKSEEIIHEKFFVFWTQLFFNFKHDLNILLETILYCSFFGLLISFLSEINDRDSTIL